MDLNYYPAVTRYDKIIFENNINCLINPVWSPPTSEILQQLSIYPNLYCDSGGYEIFQIMNGLSKTKRFFVIPSGGIYRNKDGLFLDPIDFCRTYGRLKVKSGFTIDYPLVDGSAEEYTDHLYKSYENAKIMFDCRPKYCPETDLIIPLHFSSKDQLHDYFGNMSILRPNGYSFPVRERTTWKYLMRIAYTLTFLSSMGVQRVHLLGSSKPEIIILCAASLGLEMFDRITFDSSTWRTSRNFIANILDPENLKQKDIRDLEDFSAQARLPENLDQRYIGRPNDLSRSELNKLIILSNVMTINWYTSKMIDYASDIEELKWYAQKNQNLNPKIAMTMDAIDLLQVGSTRGYGFVEKIYEWIWF